MTDSATKSSPQFLLRRLPSAICVGLLTLALIALVGVWVGLFETFGGHIWRKQMFLSAILIAGLVGGIWAARKVGLHWAFCFGVVVVARLVYAFATGIGETLYFGPDDFSHFVTTFMLSIKNQL